MGTPVVTTPQASTALLAREGEHFLIGKSADDFAAQVVQERLEGILNAPQIERVCSIMIESGSRDTN